MAAVAAARANQRDGEANSTEAGWHDDVRARALERRPHEPERPRRIGRLAWLVALVLHLVFVVGLRVALRQQLGAPAADTILRVELLDAPAPEPALPSPAPSIPSAPALPTQASHAAPPPLPEPAHTDTAPASIAPAPRLFDEGGAAALPHDIAAQIDRLQPRPDFIAPRADPSPLLAAKRPLKVRPNHFAAAWAGSDGKPLSETIWEPVTFVAEFRAPWGGRYGCGLILILFACGDIPDKPWSAPHTWAPASVLDER